jgi:hypothetical protein
MDPRSEEVLGVEPPQFELQEGLEMCPLFWLSKQCLTCTGVLPRSPHEPFGDQRAVAESSHAHSTAPSTVRSDQ